jgi:hypothetical protein
MIGSMEARLGASGYRVRGASFASAATAARGGRERNCGAADLAPLTHPHVQKARALDGCPLDANYNPRTRSNTARRIHRAGRSSSAGR